MAAALVAACNPIPQQIRNFQIPEVNPPRPDAGPESTAPVSLEPPAGNVARMVLVGSGTQVYQCRTGADGYNWVLMGPDARLYSGDRQVGRHYTGPTWESVDGSKVKAHVIAQAPSSNSGSISQLLLKADETSGPGVFAGITYVQRLRTVAGVAPADGCDAAGAGTQRQVLYSAHYVFFSAPDAH